MGRVRDIKNFRTTSYRKSQPANATQRSQENYRKETMEAVQRIGDRLRAVDNNDSFDWDFESGVVSTRDGWARFDSESGDLIHLKAEVEGQELHYQKVERWFGLGTPTEGLQVTSRPRGLDGRKQITYRTTGERVLVNSARKTSGYVGQECTELESIDPTKFIIAGRKSGLNDF